LAPEDGCALRNCGCHSVLLQPRGHSPALLQRPDPTGVHYCRYNCGPLLCLPRRHVDRSLPGQTPPACLLVVVPPPGARVLAACVFPSLGSSALKSLHPPASATARTTRARLSG